MTQETFETEKVIIVLYTHKDELRKCVRQILLESQLCVFTWFCAASVCLTCPYPRRAWWWGGAAPGSAGGVAAAAVASSPGRRRGGGGPPPLRPPVPRRTGQHSDRRSPCRLYSREYNEVTNAKFVKDCITFLVARSNLATKRAEHRLECILLFKTFVYKLFF
jgi:hypothetical protein